MGFQTQPKCFDGRFGEEMGSDEFGVTIMVHSKKDYKGMNKATAHFDHIEVTNGSPFKISKCNDY